ncbi:TIGR03915 family putative DNA repair protein [Owenweeksia hongkongensis]|uniref:TIGR03915 family putative DNA repair protein n=1 Tax=Owenweeksia hongkongensis TaxID=253245 RepID=UPI003A8FB01A
MRETVYTYDGTFEGLISVIFEIYSTKQQPLEIKQQKNYTPPLFGETFHVISDSVRANRVIKKIKALDKRFFGQLFRVFLSEKEDREMLIFRSIELLLTKPAAVKGDYRNPNLLRVKQINKEISREVHRMHAFVRFQRLADDIWFAAIEPDFDVIPLIGNHFEKRYADQKWVIYDVKRKYGLHYDLHQMEFIELNLDNSLNAEKLSSDLLHIDEMEYQQLWKEYFDSVNIKARKNMKLHIQQVPKRYWKYLFEK